jgi:hypothetical protein
MAPRDRALIALYRNFVSELYRQQLTFVLALDGRFTLDESTPPVNRNGAWYCLIRLHDAWAHFCRQAILLSAAGGVLTKQGRLLPRAALLRPGDDPFVVLKREWRTTKQPAPWMKQGPALDLPSLAVTAARLLGISNYVQFSSGMGATANAPLELKACRNFLAHRHFDTAQAPAIDTLRRRISAPAGTVAVGALAAQLIPGGVTVFEEWCIELGDLASAAID